MVPQSKETMLDLGQGQRGFTKEGALELSLEVWGAWSLAGEEARKGTGAGS